MQLPGAERAFYRPAARSWLNLVWIVPMIAACFWCATSPLFLDGDAPTAQEIAKGHVQSNAPLIWLALGFGVVMSALVPALMWSLLFYRLIADQTGLHWRSFIAWKSARWDEITDCVTMPNGREPRVCIGKRWIGFEAKNPHWPALRDFIAARVSLPDGLEAWHPKISLDAEQKRALAPKDDEGAVWIERSGWGYVAAMGAIILSVFALILLVTPDVKGGFPWAFWWFLVAVMVVWPLIAQWRCFVRCDDEGLLLAGMIGRRRVLWRQIEDLFLLPSLQTKGVYRSCIRVAGHTIELPPLGQARDAILNRIEARAVGSRSPKFELRPFARVGADWPLPATLRFRAGFWRLARNCAGLGILVLGSGAGLVALIVDIGWQYFGETRGIFAVCALGYGLAIWVWGGRALANLRTLNARGDAVLVVHENGLWLYEARTTRVIPWSEVTRLERDSNALGGAVLRVEGARGTPIEINSLVPRAETLSRLLRERSGLEWQKSPRVWREVFGITREGDAITFSGDNVDSRFPLWALGAVWAFLLIPTTSNFGSVGAALLFLLSPPLGLFLAFAAALYAGSRRVWTRCDARGLTRQGLFKRQFVAWEDVAAIGGNRSCDWVRSRGGQTIELWAWASQETSLARRELREEITRRAPGASGGWETKIASAP